MAATESYFVRNSDGTLTPTALCTGAWNTSELHVATVNGALTHELERWLAERGDDGRLITRISLDYMGVLDFDPCTVTVDVVRPGRAVELLEAVLHQHGRPAIRGRFWRAACYDTAEVMGGEEAALPPPDTCELFDVSDAWPGDYIEHLDMRVVTPPSPGRGRVWVATPFDIVAGEPSSDLARYVLLVDTMNGVAIRQSPAEWQYPNLDLTVHLFRQPVGRWIGFEASVVFGPTGQGLTSARRHDERGHVGRAEQALIVRPRA
jgi:hypothetical protein